MSWPSCRWPGATANPAPDADPSAHRRLRRRRRSGRVSRGRAHRRCRRRDPSLRFAHVGQRGCGLPRDAHAARRLHPPALDARARRPLDRGRDNRGGRRRSRGSAENGLPHAGPAAARRLRASAAASLYRAGDRPAGGDRRPARLQAHPGARAVLACRRTGADASASGSRRW